MAVFTPIEARRLVRQPAVWVSPTSYIAAHPNKANVISEMGPMHDRIDYPQDAVNLSTQDFVDPGTDGTPYDKSAVIDLVDRPYRPAVAGEAARTLLMKLIASRIDIPLNYKNLVGDIVRRGRNGKLVADSPEKFQDDAIIDAIRAELERQLVLGDSIANPLEFSGYLAGDFPRLTITAVANLLEAANNGVESINCGGGVSNAHVIFCHQRARRALWLAMVAAGFQPPEIFVERLGRKVLALPSGQGLIPIVCSNWFPVGPTSNLTSLIIVQLYGDNGVHLGVPEGSPNIRLTTERGDARPSNSRIGEHESVLLNIDNSKVVEVRDFGPVPATPT